MFLDISPFTKKAYTAINDISETTIVSIPSIACLYWSEFNDPIIFKVAAIRTIAVPIAINSDFNPPIVAPFLFIETAAFDIFSMAKDRPIIMRESSSIVFTAWSTLSGSRCVNTAIDAANNKIAIPIFFKPSVLSLKENALIALGRVSNVRPNPVKTAPNPSIGFDNASKALANL